MLSAAEGCLSRDSCQDLFGCRVVTECLTDVDEVVHVARAENESSSQLKRVFAQSVLAVSAGLGAFSGNGIVAPQQMQQ